MQSALTKTLLSSSIGENLSHKEKHQIVKKSTILVIDKPKLQNHPLSQAKIASDKRKTELIKIEQIQEVEENSFKTDSEFKSSSKD